MKKRAKATSFIKNSKNAVFALLLIAAAIAVYGIVNAATVSHTPSAIQPQGAGSGLDTDKLQGLTAADILAAGGGNVGAGGDELITWGYYASGYAVPGKSAPTCPAGWTEAYAGYGPFLFGKEDIFSGYSAAAVAIGMTSVNVCSASNAVAVSGATYSTSGGSGGFISASACSTDYYGRVTACNTCRVCIPKTTTSLTGASVLYATKTTYNGNLGGRGGADSKCTAQLPPELSGKVSNIHAFLSVSGNDEIRDMHTADSDNDGTALGYYETANTIYGYNRYWSEWTTLANNWKDLLDGSINAMLAQAIGLGSYDSEDGWSGETYWTGSTSTGQVQSPYTCSGWTSSPSGNGYAGYSASTSSLWLTYTPIYCSVGQKILCMAKYTG